VFCSRGPPSLSLAELLAALRAVGGECADELLVEVEVNELADFDGADDGAGVALAERDRRAVVADDAVAPDLAWQRVRWVVRSSVCLGERTLAEVLGWCGAG
jgi:hypothetical protein